MCLLLLITFCAAGRGLAQQITGPGQTPPGVEFDIRLAGEKESFYAGEAIRIELAFLSRMPDTYQVSLQSYDRSGRLHADQFHLEPREGVADPLADYFASALVLIGGGIGSSAVLSEKPATVVLELNEWFRFDRPGRYRLWVESSRIVREPLAHEPQQHLVQLKASSNVIEFEILPPRDLWAAQALAEAVAALDAGAVEEARRTACRALRYLGTAEAAAELARRIGTHDGHCAFHHMAGLYGTPHRALAVAEMEQLLVAPAQPVSAGFLRTLAQLKFWAEGGQPPPRYRGRSEQEAAAWHEQYNLYLAQRAAVQQQYAAQLADAVRYKHGPARLQSLYTLLEVARYQGEPSPQRAELARGAARELARAFGELPTDLQDTLLSYSWTPDERAQILAVLLRRYDDLADKDWLLRETVLRRIRQFDPAEGRRLVLAEIARPEPRLSSDILTALPDETLPDLEEALAANLEASLEDDRGDFHGPAVLLARYATEAVAPRAQAAFQRALEAGKFSAALLGYLFRHEPQFASSALRRGLNVLCRGDLQCELGQLGSVAAVEPLPQFDALATGLLDHPTLASEAVRLLQAHGSARAEEALWRRLDAWYAEWGNRPEAFWPRFVSRTSEEAARAWLGFSLMSAISGGQGWLAGPEKLLRLRDYCPTDACRKQYEDLAGQWGDRIRISFYGAGSDAASVAQYQTRDWRQLRRKLAQFPAGTRFEFLVTGRTEDQARALYNETSALAAPHGHTVEWVRK